MRKKYLSALLFGALIFASAGTFTSCKDYDDDINNLQSQVDQQKGDLAEKLKGVESSIAGLTSAQDELKATIETLNGQIAAAKDEAEKEHAAIQAAIAEAQAKAIETAKAELEATKAELMTAIQDNAADIEKLNGDLSKALGRIEALEGLQADASAKIEGLEESMKKISDQLAKADAALATRLTNVEAELKAQGERLTAIEAQIETLNSYKGKVDANTSAIDKLVKDLEDLAKRVEALESGISEADFEKIQKEIEKQVSEEAAILTAAFNKMITAVSLYVSDAQDPENDQIDFKSVNEKATVFGYDVDGNKLSTALTFEKGKQHQVGCKFLVRVSPASATLTADMISLVNSKGATLDEILSVTDVKRYEEVSDAPISGSRAASATTGIWEVSVELKNYDEETFNKLTRVDGNGDPAIKDNYIKFAVSVNAAAGETEEARNVTSAYDMTVGYGKYETAEKLYYFVDNTPVRRIKNRYGFTDAPTEYVWKNGQTPVTKEEFDKDKNKYAVAGDNRNSVSFDYFPAVQGQEITIALTKGDYDTKVTAPSNIKAMYVTLDKEFALESQPSEWNAWESYTIKGLNEVVSGTSVKISIDSDKAINDIIGFRVYAVNYDGTLVDPDGKAFYVKVGNEGIEWNAISAVLTPESTTETTTEAKATTLTKITGATKLEWTTDEVNGNKKAFTVTFKDAQGGDLFNTANPSSINGVEVTKVAKFTITANEALNLYEDGKAYNGTLVVKNADNFELATMKVTFTKELPQAMPTGFSIKTGQLNEQGIYNCYLVPNEWTAEQATKGTMLMSYVFNYGEGEQSNYTISFAEAADGANNKVIAVDVPGNEKLTVDKKFIDNEKQHATTVTYDYGQITSQKDEDGAFKSWKVTSDQKFNTVFSCIYNNTYSWKWATREQVGGTYVEEDDKGQYKYPFPTMELTYGTDFAIMNPSTQEVENIDGFVFGTSKWDSKYNSLLDPSYLSSLKVKDAKLVTTANNKEEYFDVVVAGNHITGLKATATSDNTNPTVDVPSTLIITVVDMYGHKFDIKQDMVVKRR